MKKQKVLLFGAGVLGSLYAARLQEAGADVTLLARGARYADLKKHGIVLRCFETGKETTTRVRLVSEMPADEYFDLCVAAVQKTQLSSALAVLKKNSQIPVFLFLNNTAEGPQEMIDALGRERVMLSHGNAGGERDGHIVHYMIAEEMPIGELDGTISDRLKRIASLLEKAGFSVDLCNDIISWKLYHVALAVPFAYAMELHGACNIQLSHNRKDVGRCLDGIREGIAVLRALGYPVEPGKLRLAFAIPNFILVPLFQRVLRAKIADIGMARHLRNARDEMKKLSREFFVLVDKSGINTPVLNQLKDSAEKIQIKEFDGCKTAR